MCHLTSVTMYISNQIHDIVDQLNHLTSHRTSIYMYKHFISAVTEITITKILYSTVQLHEKVTFS